jgi:GntP family gluconate:H+ symporter
MAPSFYQVLICLIVGIAVIVVLTAKLRVHPFFALLIASFVVGLGVQLPVADIINTVKDGFGNIMRSLGLIIVLGTALGVLLEKSGCTKVMANYILEKIGHRKPALAMSLTGFIVGLPLFCDSGFIVLSGLNLSIARRTGTSVIVMAVSMATGLYAVHCLVPPHPGASAAAGIIGVEYGKLMITGIIIAIPAMLVAYWYTGYMGKKMPLSADSGDEIIENGVVILPSPIKAFLPVIVPVLLIATRSFLVTMAASGATVTQIISSLGDPVIALAIGVLLALNCARPWDTKKINHWLQSSAEKAGGILVIIGAGGAFGAILGATGIGQHLSKALPLGSLGILFPFLLTFVLKTAQGSSTVAIITAASIIQPLLPALGLTTPDGRLLCVLSMGAGSMMISHANDAYFWVIAKFEKLEMREMLRVYSVATVLMGLTSLLMTYILSLFL